MADKSTNFVIKVNSKEVDLAKTSFKDFKKIIADAKKELQSLPVSDPRYKQLATDINAAEKDWKEATKAAADFGDENEKGEEQVKSYRLQVREATIALQSAEQQFGKNSEEANRLRENLKELRDQQDDFNETTRKLDDSLAVIPGPIGKIGQGMQQLGQVTNNAKSALATLGNQFNTTDKILKATLIGFIVGLLVALVAAVMNAAKSFKPLQDAFAAFDDAIGAVFDALKPLTDFILKIVVGAIKLLADGITAVAEAFGGVSNGAAKATLDLEREIKKQEQTLGRLTKSLGEYSQAIVGLFIEEKKALLEVTQALKNKNITDKEALDQRLLIQKEYEIARSRLIDKTFAEDKKRTAETTKGQQEALNAGVDNDRASRLKQIQINKTFDEEVLSRDGAFYSERIDQTKNYIAEIEKSDLDNKAVVLEALNATLTEQENLYTFYEKSLTNSILKSQEEKNKLQRDFAREDRKLINERAIAIQQLTTQLLREENERNLQAAKDSLLVLKEQNRVELEEAKLSGVSIKNLKEKQAAELLVAQENIRKAQLQLDAFGLEQQIEQQRRYSVELNNETQEYFDVRRKQIELEFERELLLADGNQMEILNSRNKYWSATLQLDKDGLQAQIKLLQTEFNSLSDNTDAFFEKQRDIEKKNLERGRYKQKLIFK
jgi:hypothetical protein